MFAQIMRKIANGEPLDPQEKSQLDLECSAIERVTQKTGSWIGTDGNAKLVNPTIENPDFRTSPLHTFHCYMTTITSIANSTDTLITFDTSAGDTSVFDFYEGDESKIRIDRSQLNIKIDGVLDWAYDPDGYRAVSISVHDEDGTQIASKQISLVEAVEHLNIPTRMNFSYTEDIRTIFPNGIYFSVYVRHEAGASLNLEQIVMSVNIA